MIHLFDSTDVGIHVISELSGDVLLTTFDNSWPKCAHPKCAHFSVDKDHAVAVELCPNHNLVQFSNLYVFTLHPRPRWSRISQLDYSISSPEDTSC